MRAWAEEHDLEGEQREDLFYHIAQMDEVFLKFKARKLKDGATVPTPRKGKR